MNAITLFKNEIFGEVRVTEVNGEPVFCLADVCKIVGIKNSREVKTRLEIEDVIQTDTPTPGGIQSITFITEAGLYDVIIRSDSPKAKPFRKWVTSDILPSIRRHGMYATDATIDKLLSDPDFAIRALENLKIEREKRIAAEQQLSAQAPKVLFADAVSTSSRSCLIAELAKMLQQNGVAIGQNKLFAWMREHHYLCTIGEYYNQPTQKAMERGLFEIKKTSIQKPDGTVLVTSTTKVTGKGQAYFINKFLGKN
jgi:anti-repressor protein